MPKHDHFLVKIICKRLLHVPVTIGARKDNYTKFHSYPKFKHKDNVSQQKLKHKKGMGQTFMRTHTINYSRYLFTNPVRNTDKTARRQQISRKESAEIIFFEDKNMCRHERQQRAQPPVPNFQMYCWYLQMEQK